MKTMLLRSIGVSLFLLCLTFAAIADEGDMGAGSKTGNGGGLASDTTIQTNTKNDTITGKEIETDFFGWITKVFTDILS